MKNNSLNSGREIEGRKEVQHHTITHSGSGVVEGECARS